MDSRLGKFAVFAMTSATLLALVATPRVAVSQAATGALEAPQVRDMVKAMGYETKELIADAGKEKYEFTIEKSDLNIPIAIEVSPSKRYIWLTVYLGDATKIKNFPAMADKLLRENGKLQPTQFYVTKSDRLMTAIAIENRGPVDAAILRRSFEKLAEDVGSSKAVWQETP